MRRTLTLGICLFVLLSFSSFAGAESSQDDKNAPEMLIESTRFLEERPFDKEAKKVRSWALNWVIATDKVGVRVCSLLVANIDKNYKYCGEIFGQYTIAMAAFKLANPDKPTDEDAVQQAGIESAITSYEAMVKEQTKAKNAFMDSLIAKRLDGSLAKYVLENNCKGK